MTSLPATTQKKLGLVIDLGYVEIGLIVLSAFCLRLFRNSWFERVERAGTRLANRRALCIALAFFAPIADAIMPVHDGQVPIARPASPLVLHWFCNSSLRVISDTITAGS